MWRAFLLAAARPSQAQNAAAAAGWPHTITTENANVLVYQPQAISWPDHAKLTARAALAITRRGEKAPIIGTVEVSFATRTDPATDQVVLSDPQLVASHFPALDTAQATQLEARIGQGLPQIATRSIALRAVLLSLKEHNAPAGVELPTYPPAIFHSASPASLVVFDGEPVLAPVGKTGLSFAVNTNWDVFTDDKDWYLLNNGLWLAAASFNGPYKLVTKLPPAFKSIPADKNFADVRKAIPPHAGKPAVVPTIFVSTKPAEIIVTQGPPLKAVGSAPAPAPSANAPPASAGSQASRVQELRLVRRSCGQDFRSYCQGVELGGGRALQCLKENESKLSPTCKSALTSLPQGR